MNAPPGVVAVTGAAGYIGARLLQELGPLLIRLVAFDINPLISPLSKLGVQGGLSPSKGILPWKDAPAREGLTSNIIAYQQDLTRPIGDILHHHRVVTLVHLAHIIKPGRNRREINAIRLANLNALRSVLDSCSRSGVKHVIYLSSHTIYGAHKDNHVPLTEGSPLRPSPDFPYGYDKFLAEQVLREFSQEHQHSKITILRSCVVLGPAANNYITRAFFRPVLLGIRGYDPPLQFLHEDDLARVLTTIIQQGVPGVFNVAGEGVVHYREMVRAIRRKLVSLPAFLAYPLVQLTWSMGIQHDASAAGLDLVRYPMVVSTETLKKGTGYRFQYSSLEALTAFANTTTVAQGRREL
jgi:UDP-glucose 4-epimerase